MKTFTATLTFVQYSRGEVLIRARSLRDARRKAHEIGADEVDGLFKAAFGCRVVVIKIMIATQQKPQPPVGWIKGAGAFENFDALLKVIALAGFVGGLNHPVQGAGGSQLR